MRKATIAALAGLTAASAAGSAGALEYDHGPLTLRLDIKGSAQGAWFDPPDAGGDNLGWNGDWSVRGSIDYITEGGWLIGARVEVDSDFDIESDTADLNDLTAVELDEAYGYIASRFGRIEVGLQDGPADLLSYHAPILGLGQVRGDFIRYAGAQRALMSPFDSRDSFKISYISPPLRGFQFGASWGPEFTARRDRPLITDRTIQENPVELAARYRFAAGPASIGVSGAYVMAEADPATGKEDISSWSAGGDVRWLNLVFGAAYVERGDSNLIKGTDQSEVNFGVAWYGKRWRLAASSAIIDSNLVATNLAGIGGTVDLYKHYFQFKVDAVWFEDDFVAALIPFTEDGFVLVGELELRL